MTPRDKLVKLLKKCAEGAGYPGDECYPDGAHQKAEHLLLQMINDPEITDLWDEAPWWYA